MNAWGPAANAYFAEHAIDPELASDVGVTEEDGAVVFPTVDGEGNPAPRRRRLNDDGHGPKMRGPAGAPLAAWWPDGAIGDRVLVCEGESDALAVLSVLRLSAAADGAAAFARSAIDSVVAVPGTGFGAERLCDALLEAGASEAILGFDADEAGRRYTGRVAKVLATTGISAASLVLPAGKDLASVLAATDDRGGQLADLLSGVDDDAAAEPPSAANDRAERLAWRWADELTASTSEPAWVLRDYLAAGTKVILAGLPKAGKTTLVAALVEAVASGPSFLGRGIKGGPVLLASEEGDGTLAPKLAGLPAGRVRVLTRDVTWPKPSWSELIADATREAAVIGAVLLVIDSVAFWAALEPEREKDPGATQAIMDALDEATRAGLAVLLIHHQRKAPGDHGAAVRGSGALAGAVDVVIEYERLGGDARPSQRRLVALSRWPQTPDVLVIDYDRHNCTWRVVGEAEGRAGSDLLGIRERLLSMVPATPPGASEPKLVELVGVDKRKLSGPLRELVEEGLIERDGAGKKGDPYTYAKAAPKAAPAEGSIVDRDAALPLRGAASNPMRIGMPPTEGEKTRRTKAAVATSGAVSAIPIRRSMDVATAPKRAAEVQNER